MRTKKIAIICPHPVGVAPSQRLKYEQYFADWRSQGWTIDVYPFQTNDFWKIISKKGNILSKILWTFYGYLERSLLLFKLYQFDIVYIHLWVTPLGPPFFEHLYRWFSKKIIYDLDDLIFIGNTNQSNSWVSKLKGKQKSIYLLKHANAVITTTPYLVKTAEKYNKNVYSIPPTIPINFLTPSKNKKNNPLIIGWSGSSTTLKYLDFIKEALLKVHSTHPFQFVIIGVDSYSINGIPTICYAWSEKIEKEIIPSFDIALYPLSKELWSEGKYGGKMIQYLAAGLPMVVSNANEVIQKVLKNDDTALIVENTTKDWEQAIIKLITNPDLRNSISLNARALFESKFTLEGNSQHYLSILNQVSAS